MHPRIDYPTTHGSVTRARNAKNGSLEPNRSLEHGGPVDLPPRHPLAIQRARRLRRDMTDAERVLWWHLSNNGLETKWRRQEPVGRYIVDFLTYRHRLIVELDGSQHAESSYDRKRDGYLRDLGFQVLRFWNEDVFEEVDDVLDTILAVIQGDLDEWEGHI